MNTITSNDVFIRYNKNKVQYVLTLKRISELKLVYFLPTESHVWRNRFLHDHNFEHFIHSLYLSRAKLVWLEHNTYNNNNIFFRGQNSSFTTEDTLSLNWYCKYIQLWNITTCPHTQKPSDTLWSLMGYNT